MSDSEPSDLLSSMLLRLRLERDLGIESVRPVPLALADQTVSEEPTQASTRAQPDGGVPAKSPARVAPAPASGDRWGTLEAEVLACTKCPLHKGRTKAVFGEGDRHAKVVFVGEGPGFEEDRSGRPFVGKAGQLLNKIIAAVGWKREEVYICNIVKCRPPQNRTPLPDEVGRCKPYLEEQLELLKPEVIVALGRPAAQALFQTTEAISAMRGRWRLYKGIRVMPTYHPAFVLRNYTKATRGAVWEDMKKVKAWVEEGKF